MICELLQIGQGIIERGLIFGIVVAAVYLSSRLINFDNLAIEFCIKNSEKMLTNTTGSAGSL